MMENSGKKHHLAVYFLILSTYLTIVQCQLVSIVPHGFVHLRPAGQDVLFSCSLSGFDPSSEVGIVWLDHSGHQILRSDGVTQRNRRVYTLEKLPHVLVLHIDKLEVGDAGVYSCQVTLDGRYYRRTAALEIYKAIDYVGCPEIQTLARGREGVIKCEVTGSPSPIVSWTSNGRIITTDGHNEVTKKGLKILDVKDEDSGNYICMATIDAIGSIQTKKISVRVVDPPTDEPVIPHINHIHRNSSLQNDIIVTCIATAIPPPDINWLYLKDSIYNLLQKDEEVNIKQTTDGSVTVNTLTISRSSSKQTGSFKCAAINGAGTAEHVFNITDEESSPENMAPPQIEKVHMNRTQGSFYDVMITCVARGSPAPNLRWYRQNRAGENDIIWSRGRYRIEETQLSDVTVISLVISGAREDDEGTYLCSASNSLASVSQPFQLTLLEAPPENMMAPNIDNVFVNKTGLSKKDLKVTCVARGIPSPQISFNRRSTLGIYQLLLPTDRMMSVEQSETATQQTVSLTLMNAEPGDDGLYQCVASNIAGSVRQDFEINVGGAELEGDHSSQQSGREWHYQTGSQSRISSQSQGQLETAETGLDVEWLNTNIKDGLPVSVPSNLAIESDDKDKLAAWLSWDWVGNLTPEDYVSGFQVRYSTDLNAPKDTWKTLDLTGDTNRSYKVRGLTGGQDYYFIVRGTNSHGLGPASQSVFLHVPLVPDRPPRSFVIVRGTPTDVKFSWNQLTEEIAGAPVTGYTIYYSTSSEMPLDKWQTSKVLAEQQHLTLGDLSPGTTYYFRIQATNSDGGSPVSRHIVYRTPTVRVPDPPSYVHVSSTSSLKAKLRINRPANTGGYPIDGYIVEYGPFQEASTRNTFDSDNSLFNVVEIENLTPSTLYLFKISARSRIGYSKPLEIQFTTPREWQQPTQDFQTQTQADFSDDKKWLKQKTGKQGQALTLLTPRNVHASDYQVDNGSVRIDWQRPLLPTLRVKGYQILWGVDKPQGDLEVLEVEGSSRVYMSTRIQGLSLNTAYRFQIRTKDFRDNLSPYTAPVTFLTPALPGPPSDVQVSNDDPAVVSVRIRRPIDLGGNALVAYGIKYWTEDGEIIEISHDATDDRSGYNTIFINQDTLLSGTTYHLKVYAVTKDGQGPSVNLDFDTPQRYQNQGTVAVEQELAGSQQGQQTEDLDLEWLRETQRQQEPVAPEIPVTTTEIPRTEGVGISYTVSWEEFVGTLASLTKYVVKYREVEVKPYTTEVSRIVNEFTTEEVQSDQGSVELYNLEPNHYYQIQVEAYTLIGFRELKFNIKDFVYWVPPETLIAPHISHINQNKTSDVSNDVIITCEASGSPLPHVTWSKIQDGQTHKIQESEGVTVQHKEIGDKAFATLTIQQVSGSDYGTYVCSAVSPSGNTSFDFQFQKDAPIVDPEAPHVYRIHVNRTGPEGEDIKVFCKATGNPVPLMKFLRDEKTVRPDSSGRIVIEAEDFEGESLLTMLIQHPVSQDAGDYFCYATNAFGTATQKFDVRTEYSPANLVAPHIYRVHVNRTGDGDRDLFMVCKSTGSPAPEMRWSRPNDQGGYDIVWPDDKHEIIQNEDVDSTVNSLLVRQAVEADFGTYRCTATNFADLVNQDIDVRFGPPENVVSPTIRRLLVSTLVDDVNVIEIKCIAVGDPAPEMFVLRQNTDGEYKVIFPDDRITINQDQTDRETVFTLHINNHEDGDTGLYSCSAVNGGGRVQQLFSLNTIGVASNFFLSNLARPEIVRINTKRPEAKGGDVILSCVAHGSPSPNVRWKTFGKTVSTNDRFKVEETIGIDETVTSLIIRSPDVTDAHTFECEAENVVNLVTKVYNLSVQDLFEESSITSPHIGHIHLNTTGPENQDVLITCLAVGYPTPTMSLVRQGKDGSWNAIQTGENGYNKRHFTDGEEGGIQLLIPQATYKDAGLYKCSAKNLAGDVSQTMQADLPVKSPENTVQPHISRIHINRTGHDNTDVTVTCIAQGYPAPEMKWIRYDQLVLPRGRFSVQSSKGDDQTVISLTILNAVPEDEGSYRCSAVNFAGSEAQLFNIRLKETVVKYPPHIGRIHVNRTGIEQENLQVTCVASGRAEMSFWKFEADSDYQIVFPEDNMEILDDKTEERTVLSMIFYNPRPDQGGRYNCLARNPAGKTTQYFAVHTEDEAPIIDATVPHVSRIHVNRTGDSGQDVTVTCKVDGHPAPATNWLKRDNSGQFSFIWSEGRYTVYEYRDAQSTTLTLTISEANPEDDGVFLCSASNAAGDSRQLFNLNVFEAPPENLSPPTLTWIHVSREGVNNEDVVVSCTGVGQPAPELGLWRRYEDQGEDFLIQVGGRVSVNYTKGESETKIYMTVKDADQADEGTYVCSAANVAGSVKQPFKIQVTGFVDVEQVTPHISRVHLNTTDTGDYMATCIANGSPLPLMDWLRPNQEGKPKSMDIADHHVVNEHRTETEVIFSLVITNPSDIDKGEYYCSARNPAGRVIQKFVIGRSEIPLADQNEPHISHLHMNFTGEGEKNIMLTCLATGVPPPLLSFSKSFGVGDFTVIWPSDRRYMEGSSTQTSSVLSLLIYHASSDDEGLYRCTAVNEAGLTSQVSKIQLPSGPPEHLITPIVEHIHINKTSNDHLMVTCQSKGSPSPEMRWTRRRLDGLWKDVGAHDDDVTIEQYDGTVYTILTLVVANAEPEEWDGLYACRAVNYAGSTQQDFNLTVQQESPPANQISPHIEHIHINKTVLNETMITCITRGFPSPHVNLLLQDNQGNYEPFKPKKAENVIYSTDSSQTTLAMILENFTGGNNWRCQADNVGGNARQDFTINVKGVDIRDAVSPHISRIHVDRVEDRPGDVTMLCKASGNPLPNMNWWKYKGDQFTKIWPDERIEVASEWTEDTSILTLLIRDATEQDDGEYLCSAANTAGTTRQPFHFKLLESVPDDMVAAEIQWVHQNRTGPYNKAMMITCIASGTPPPEMRWYKLDNTATQRLVWPSEDVLIEQFQDGDDTILTLKVSDPKDQDDGIYLCEASNIGGTISYDIKVQLKEKHQEGKQAPHINHIHVDRAGVNDEDVTIMCQASGYPAPDIKWLKDFGEPGQRDYQYLWSSARFDAVESKTPNQTTLNITMKSAEPGYEGNYLCVATNIVGEVQQDFDVYTTDKHPEDGEAPHIAWVHLNRTGLDNSDLSITCVATGAPPPLINFYRGAADNRQIIGSSSRTVFYQVQGTSKTILKLTYLGIQNTDAGPHLCTADNVFGRRSQEFNVITEEPEILNQQRPYVKAIQVSRIETRQDDIVLSCVADGIPAPELHWWKNEGDHDTPKYRRLWPSDNYEIKQLKGDNRTVLNLTLVNLTSSDQTAMYMCSAVNSGGEARQLFDLTNLPSVTEPENLPEVNKLSVRRTEENEIKLNCRGDGLPPPDLQIYKLDDSGHQQLIKPSDRIRFFETKGVESSFLGVTISEASGEDEGTYLCAASNRRGVDRDVADYTVKDAPYDDEVTPHIRHIHLNRTGHNGEDVMITCLVEGSPAPSITWRREYSRQGAQNYRDLPNIANYVVNENRQSEHSIGTLIIRRVTRREAGWYRCEVKNVVGEAKQEFEVLIKEEAPKTVPPHIGEIHINKTGDNRQHVTLTCIASGEPAPGVRFYKQNENGKFYLALPDSEENMSERRGIGETTLQLVINDFQFEDFGNYRCAATNLGGRVSRTFNVQIDDTPREDQKSPFVDSIYVKRAGEGDRDVTLTCIVTGVPPPELRWQQRDLSGNELVWPKDRFQIAQTKADGYSAIVLTIREASYADDGSFICEAANIVDRVTQSFSLRVFGSPPQALSAPKVGSVYVNQSGSDVNIYCVATGLPAPDLYLSKLDRSGNFVAVQPSSRFEFSQTKDEQQTVLLLKIKEPTEQNAGEYSCTANSLIGTSRRKFEFSVQAIRAVETPGRPYVSRIAVDQPQAEADVLTVKCYGQGDPQPELKLFKRNPTSGQDQQIETGGRYIVDESYDTAGVILTVTVNNPTPTDSGLYLCRADNTRGFYRTAFNLTFQEYTIFREGQPEFVEPRVERTGVNGVDVLVRCRARGNPPPDILFLRQTQEGLETKYKAIITDGRHIVEEDKRAIDTVLQVTIRQATSDDAGTYLCSARNNRGSSRQQFKLTIQDSETFPGKPTGVRTRANENSILVGWAPPRDTKQPVTGYIVSYGLGYPDMFKQGVTADKFTHLITNLNPGSEYTISVRAENQYGQSESVYVTATTAVRDDTKSVGPLLPPVGLRSEVNSSREISAMWEDPYVTDSKHHLLYRIKYSRVEGGGRTIHYLNSTSRTARILYLFPDQQYEISVQSLHDGRRSPWSFPIRNHTLKEKPLSDWQIPLAGLRSRVNSSTQMLLSWQDPFVEEEDHKSVLYRIKYFKVHSEEGGRDVHFINSTSRSALVPSLSPGVLYEFSVQVLHDGQPGPWSVATRRQTHKESVVPGGSHGPEVEDRQPYLPPDDSEGGVEVSRSGYNNEDITIKCHSSRLPPAELHFYKQTPDGRYQPLQDRGQYVVHPETGSSREMVIRKATVADAGNYVCEAINSEATYQFKFSINLRDREISQGQVPSGGDREWIHRQQTTPATVPPTVPEFEDVKVQRTGSSGEDVTVVCEARGHPAAELAILKYNTDTNQYDALQVSERYTVDRDSTGRSSSLTLVIAQAKVAIDAGNYLCTAKNRNGRARQQFQLNFREAEVEPQTTGQSGQGRPVFEDVQVERSGNLQQDVVVTCKVRGSPSPDLQLWREINDQDRIKYEAIQDGGRISINVNKANGYSVLRAVIKDAISSDAGRLICSGRNSVGSIRQQFTLTIEDSPSADEGSPKFESVNVDRSGTQSEDVVVTCKVSGSPVPNVRLSRAESRDGSIQTGGRYTVTETKYSTETILTVVIGEATSVDAGIYYCSAENDKGTLNQQFTLTIEDPTEDQGSQQGQITESPPQQPEGFPKFESVNVDRSGIQSENVVVTCKVRGNPTPELRLWREVTFEEGTNYQPIQAGGRYEVEQTKSDVITTLRAVIRQATSADAGTYLCSAESSVGRLRQQFQLTIGEIQKVEQPDQDVQQSQAKGFPVFESVNVDRSGIHREHVVVTCKVSGSPAPDLRIWREVAFAEGVNFQPVLSNGRIDVVERKYRRFTILRAEINDATSSDAGSYVCSAQNTVGSLRQQFKLTIGAVEEEESNLPRIIDVSVIRTGVLQRDFKLTCTVEGSPSPIVSLWKYHNSEEKVQLENSQHILLESSETELSATIRDVSAADAGTYQCEAANSFGIVRQQFNLTVQVDEPEADDGLKIGGVSVDSSGEKNQDVTISCTGLGSPAPSMRLWRYQPNADPAYAVVGRTARIRVDQRRGVRESVLEVVISQSTQADAGTYICSATNSEGTVRQQFDLTIEEHEISGKDLPKLGAMTVERTGVDNEDALITCTAAGVPPPDVKMYKENPEESATQYRLLQSGGNLVVNEAPGETGTVLTVLVRSVHPADTGVFMCEASNSGGTVRQSFQWKVEAAQSDSPDLPEITSVNSEHEADHVMLVCQVRGKNAVEMKWWKRSSTVATEYQIIFPSDRLVVNQYRYSEMTFLLLTIKTATSADSGEYLCTVQNKAGSDQRTLELTVTDKKPVSKQAPSIIKISEDEMVDVGLAVKIECAASGIPTPEVKWWKYNPSSNNEEFQLITPDNAYDISKVNKGKTVVSYLTVREIGEKNSGLFLCTAVNKHGSLRRNITLTIKETAKLSEEIPNTRTVERHEDVLATKNDPLSQDNAASSNEVSQTPRIILIEQEPVIEGEGMATCVATGNPPPSLKWWRTEERLGATKYVLLNTNNRIRVEEEKGEEETTLSLIFIDGRHSDSGTYLCIASNKFGQIRKSINITVKSTQDKLPEELSYPRIVEHPKTVVASTNDPVKLVCLAEGIPPPTISWFKDGRPVFTSTEDPGSDKTMLADGSLFFLRVSNHPPDISNAGVYHCVATNTHGSVSSRNASLEVTDPGYIAVDFLMKITAKQIEEKLQVRCEITGSPVPEFIWLKNGRRIPKTDKRVSVQKVVWGSRLRIDGIQLKDAGNYTCVGYNAYGRRNTTAKLVVINKNLSPSSRNKFVPDTGASDISPVGDRGNIGGGIGEEGFCQTYQGNTCSKVIGNQSVFVQSIYTQVNTEERLVAALSIIASSNGFSTRCQLFFIQALCYHAFPLCDESESHPKPREICKEECFKLETDLCKTEFGLAKLHPLINNEAILPNCVELSDPGTPAADNCKRIGVKTDIIQQEVEVPTITEVPVKTPLTKSVTIATARPTDNPTIQVPMAGVSNTPKIILISQDSETSARCRATGKPAPSLKWWRTEERQGATQYDQLATDSRIKLEEEKGEEETTLSLTFIDGRHSDSGTYLCIASNKFGQIRKSINITVKDKTSDGSELTSGIPPTVTSPATSPLPYNKGSTEDYDGLGAPEILRAMVVNSQSGEMYLVCQAVGNPPPQLKWWKYDTSTRSPSYRLIPDSLTDRSSTSSLSGGVELTLTLNPLLPEDTGTYQCTAHNYLGQDRRSVHVEPAADDSLASSTPTGLSENWTPTTSPASTTFSLDSCQKIGGNVQVQPSGNVEARTGDGLVLTCVFTDYDPYDSPQITWFNPQNDAVLNDTSVRLFQLPESGSLYKMFLFVDVVQAEDAGDWTCRVLVNDGKVRCGKVTVFVQHDITFKDIPSSVETTAGQDVIVGCEASGSPLPDTSWSLNGQTINVSDGRYRQTALGLLIKRVRPSDAGKYLCEAKVPSTGRYESKQILLYVDGVLSTGRRHQKHKPSNKKQQSELDQLLCPAERRLKVPILSVEPSEGEVLAYHGRGVVFSCEAVSYSPCDQITLTWTSPDGQKLIETDTNQRRHVQKTSSKSLSLIIRDVDYEDAGVWLCTGATQNTHVSKVVTLSLRKDIKMVGNTSISVLPGQEIMLECLASGNPIPAVTWLKDGRPITEGASYLDGLLLSNVSKEAEGNYTCQAFILETGRYDTLQIQLLILAPPVVTIELSNDRVGSFSALICTGVGVPAPQLTWYKNTEQITQHSQNAHLKLEDLVEDTQSSKSVIFIALEEEDGGNYTCISNSEGGHSQTSFLLEPLSRPGLPGKVSVKEVSRSSVILAINPPNEENKSPILDYHVAYISMANFVQSRKTVPAEGDEEVLVKIDGLAPQTTYLVRVYARNIVDFGSFKEIYITTSE